MAAFKPTVEGAAAHAQQWLTAANINYLTGCTVRYWQTQKLPDQSWRVVFRVWAVGKNADKHNPDWLVTVGFAADGRSPHLV